MRLCRLLALGLFASAPHATWAADAPTSSGPGALALAGVVGLHDPSTTPARRRALLAVLNGEPKEVAKTPAFTVVASSVLCRASDVAISTHDCELTFGGQKASVTGRAAHEIYATELENGVRQEGAAGSLYAGLKDLECRLDPAQIAEAAGGGATCRFKPAQ